METNEEEQGREEAGVYLRTPEIEEIMEWESEGGCYAACDHNCWVEPDGYCEHGKPSWMLKLGYI